jgi:hypothetical protein
MQYWREVNAVSAGAHDDRNISPVDHFPSVLRHLSNERLGHVAAHYARLARKGSRDEFLDDRVAKCHAEIKLRGALIPWLRRRQLRFVA